MRICCLHGWLQAQRLAAAEAILKSMHADHPATVGAGGGSPTDVEAKLKKLAADVRTLKERSGIAKQGMMQVHGQLLLA